MRNLTIIATLILLILAAGVFAAEKPLSNSQTDIPQRMILPPTHTHITVLRLDPMHMEIATIIKDMRVREDKLLNDLLTATDEEQSNRIIRRIERLDTDRELALLKVQARYARLDQRYDLEREIKGKILKILQNDLALLQ